MKKPINLLCNNKFNQLATYNSEISRGILHTDNYKQKMETLQNEYNQKMKEYYKSNNIRIAKQKRIK